MGKRSENEKLVQPQTETGRDTKCRSPPSQAAPDRAFFSWALASYDLLVGGVKTLKYK